MTNSRPYLHHLEVIYHMLAVADICQTYGQSGLSTGFSECLPPDYGVEPSGHFMGESTGVGTFGKKWCPGEDLNLHGREATST